MRETADPAERLAIRSQISALAEEGIPLSMVSVEAAQDDALRLLSRRARVA
jgi:hypothetical protein